jgi:hypothetical protein
LAKDSAADVRAATCECLGEWGQKNARETLISCLKDNAWFVRMRAVRALLKIFGQDAIPEVAGLINDSSWLVKEAVKDAMVSNIEKSLPAIEVCLASGDSGAKKYCVEAMVDAGYITRLLTQIFSENSQEKQKAVRLLDVSIKSGFHFGFRKSLLHFDAPTQEKIIQMVSTIDARLARALRHERQ